MKNKIEELANKLQATSDPNRLKILCILLENKKVCVSDIAKKLKLDIAVVSYHLQALLQKEMVNSIREGKTICYQLKKSKFNKDLKNLICKYK